MSDISHVDASSHARRPPSERLPARDFAHELAKRDTGEIAADSSAADGSRQPREPTGPAASSAGTSSTGMPQMRSATSPGSADAGTDAAAQERQSVLVQPIGITEELLGSRVFGVHLLAGTYLSELATAGEAGAPAYMALPIMTNTGMSAPLRVGASNASPVLNEVPLDREFHETAKALMSGLANGEAKDVAKGSTSASVPSVPLGEAVAMFWPESSFRLTKQGDGSAVIWLRDYRTPDEHAPRLVDELVKAALAANMRLGRIVLNGREVWASRQNY